jgi:DNA-binding NarL/FixJ family response regulator
MRVFFVRERRRGIDNPGSDRVTSRNLLGPFGDVLGVMVEGKSNQGIAESLFVTEAAVQKHVTNIVHKLALGATPTGHRRVLAVLADLRELRASRRSEAERAWR